MGVVKRVLLCLNRDTEKVLRDDRERLRRMQKSQPRFTSDQRRELIEQHTWMRRGGLPKAIDVKACVNVSVTLIEHLFLVTPNIVDQVCFFRFAAELQG